MGFTRIVLFYCTIRYRVPAKRSNRFCLRSGKEPVSEAEEGEGSRADC